MTNTGIKGCTFNGSNDGGIMERWQPKGLREGYRGNGSGNSNIGKSSLINQLTGGPSQKGNKPG
jgi:ribosome biogenesis GTPase A